MRLTREQLNAYNGMLHEFQSGAESYFRDLMDAWRAENKDAKVSETREFCIFAVNETLGIYGPAAEELAAQMFETVCEEEGIEATAEIPEEPVPQEMIENAAHYNAGKLVDGDWAAFVGAEAALTNFYVRHSAYETMKKSCKDNDVRWARVPTGRETCGYCFMLASRGFDYVSEDTAHAGSHRHCDCVVMPGVPGRTKVDGYDPDELYKRWKECEEAAGSKNFRDVIKEVETRDWDWVWGGKTDEPAPVPRVELDVGAFPSVFTKSKATMKRTMAFVDYINGVEGADPKMLKIYGSLGKIDTLSDTGAVFEVKNTVDGHAVTYWRNSVTKSITKAVVNIPKMEGAVLHGQAGTTAHELGHLIDLFKRDGNGDWMSDTRLRAAIRNTSMQPEDIPRKTRELFREHAGKLSTVRGVLKDELRKREDALSDEYAYLNGMSYMDGLAGRKERDKKRKELHKWYNEASDYESRNAMPGVGNLEDIYDALTAGTASERGYTKYGHGSKYYRNEDNRAEEIWANYCALSLTSPELLDTLRSDVPELVDALDAMRDEIYGGID